jgi:hypothetical protein
MKCFTILFIVLFFTSCASPAKMFNSGLSKINKAINRDPSLKLPADTIRDYRVEIIPGKDGKDSIIRETIIETINDCKYDEIKLKSAKEVRVMKRMFKDSLTHTGKMYRLETKRLKDSLIQMNKHYKTELKVIRSNNSQQKVADRNKTKQERGGWLVRIFGQLWWLLLAIGFMLGIYISNLLPKVPNIFKRK